MGMYFSRNDLKCHCRRADCDAKSVDPLALSALIAMRIEWGHALFMTSSTRCKKHNAKVGGAPHSQHLEGVAFDIACSDSNQVQVLSALAEKHGFRGIGTGKRLLHIDMRSGPQARWTYPDK